MMQTKFKRQKIGEALELLMHTVVGVWTNTTFSQENMDAWPENGDIINLDIIPKIISIVNGNEEGLDNISIPSHSNTLRNFAGDGDDLVPTPLQNTTKTYWYIWGNSWCTEYQHK